VEPVGQSLRSLLGSAGQVWSRWPLARKQLVLILLALAPIPLWVKFVVDAAGAQKEVYRRDVRRFLTTRAEQFKATDNYEAFLSGALQDLEVITQHADEGRWPIARLAIVTNDTRLFPAISSGVPTDSPANDVPSLLTEPVTSSAQQGVSGLDDPVRPQKTVPVSSHSVTIDRDGESVTAWTISADLWDSVESRPDRELVEFVVDNQRDESSTYFRTKLGTPAPPDESAPDPKWFVVEFDTDLEGTRYRAAVLPATVPIVMALASAALLVVVLSRFVLRPVRELSGVMRRIAQQRDYSIRIPASQLDEIGDLQAGFNQMISEVADLTSGLNLANRKLNRSNVSLDKFAYTVAHDLKEPLRNVTLIVQRLREEFAADLDPEFSRRLDQIGQQCDREMRMIGEILKVSRLGRNLPPARTVDLEAIVSATYQDLQERFEECHATLEVNSPLPVVKGWPDLLTKLFQNLMSNAIKYNDKPVRRVRVFGRTTPGNGHALVAVQDNGIGIRRLQLPKLFELFTPLHDPERFGVGDGAGLANVKGIVEIHNGHIRVFSKEGEGTTFVIRLPAVSAARRGTILAAP
jgi:signal transduction histidine kinase